MSKAETTQARRPAVAQKVKWTRQQAGWSQAQAAAEMGVARGTFNAWETGRAQMPPAKLHKLKHLAHVNFSEFKPELVYDADGFPFPLTRSAYVEALREGTSDDLDAKLVLLEGASYIDREVERYVIEDAIQAAICEVKPRKKAELRKEFFANNEKYLAKLILDNGW